MKTRRRRFRGRQLPSQKVIAAALKVPETWTKEDLQKVLLDPRSAGVGSFPPILEKAVWIAVQVKHINELGPEAYARAQLEVLEGAFEGYADMLSERVDIRPTEDIREDYRRMLATHPDDPEVREMCEAGMALLDAEVVAWDAPPERAEETQANLYKAKERMDAAILALNKTEDELRDFLQSWRPIRSPSH